MQQKSPFIIIIFFYLIIRSFIFPQEQLAQSIEGIQVLISQERWEEALQTLERAEANCTDSSCLAKINFTYAYLYDLYSGKNHNQRKSRLDSAVAYYLRVLSVFPKNHQTYYNLAIVYQKIGQTERAIEALKSASRILSPMSLKYTLAVGDVFSENEIYDSAYVYYQSALQTNPFSKNAHQKIVKLYKYKNYEPDTIMQHCLQLTDLQFNDLAAQVLETLIRQNFSKSEKKALNALVLWLNLKNELQYIHPTMLNTIPSQWGHPAVIELRNLVQKPIETAIQLRWWPNDQRYGYSNTLNLQPNCVIGGTLRIMAKNALNVNDISTAQKLYESSCQIITPQNVPISYRYSPDQIPYIYFQVAGELGILYTKYKKDIDQDENLFRALERDLFSGKSRAYNEFNNRAIRHFHTTLGLIYAARGQWEKGPDIYQNGIFQLENAINKALKEKNLPYLQRLLAGGYESIKEYEKAFNTYIAAGRSYMNNDDFKSTKRMLDKVDSLQNGFPSEELNLLQDVRNLRLKIKNLSPLSSSLKYPQELLQQINQITLNQDTLFSSFLKIQKFKMLADIGNRAKDLGLTKNAALFHSEALTEANTMKFIPSIGDITRLEEIRRTILQNILVKAEQGPYISVYQSGKYIKEAEKDKEWIIYLPDKDTPYNVIVSQDLITGAQIINSFENNLLDMKRLPKMVIEKEKIILNARLDENQNQIVLNWLEKYKGSKKITFEKDF